MGDKPVVEDHSKNIHVLPIVISNNEDGKLKALLIKLGFKFLRKFDIDDRLQYVEFPDGWQFKIETPKKHYVVIDPQGRERANAFIDDTTGKAFLSICRRFTIQFDRQKAIAKKLYVANILDYNGTVIYSSDAVVGEESRMETPKIKDATVLATDWIDDEYPDWRNPGAYWDIELPPPPDIFIDVPEDEHDLNTPVPSNPDLAEGMKVLPVTKDPENDEELLETQAFESALALSDTPQVLTSEDEESVITSEDSSAIKKDKIVKEDYSSPTKEDTIIKEANSSETEREKATEPVKAPEPVKVAKPVASVPPPAVKTPAPVKLVPSATVMRTIIPINLGVMNSGNKPWTYLESLGFKFIGPYADNSLFQVVELPQGWSVALDETKTFLSVIMDEKKRERLLIGYSTVGFFAKASIIFCTRYHLYENQTLYQSENKCSVSVYDQDKRIFATPPHVPLTSSQTSKNFEAAMAEARLWISTRHPRYEDETAYWD